MGNQFWSIRKDIALRCAPGVAGIVCLVVAFVTTSPSSAIFVLLLGEGILLFGLAAFLLWRYLKTPA